MYAGTLGPLSHVEGNSMRCKDIQNINMTHPTYQVQVEIDTVI